jgi:FkbM family methyltransferase
MRPLVEMVRWFNDTCPWHQLKPSLGKWAGRRIGTVAGPRVYGGIHGGLRMRLDLADAFERSVYLNYENAVMVRLIRTLLLPGDVFVDGGANIGQLALVASRSVGPNGHVYAFEPQPRAIERLRENLMLNEAANVTIVPKGCWDAPGTATLYDFAGGAIDLPSMGRRPDREVVGSTSIETVRIDEVVPPPAKLIKLDVEGAEWSALRGAERLLTGPNPPHLLLELNQKTSKAFGFHPLALVDWILERPPRRRLHLVKANRMLAIDRDRLKALLDESETKNRNVWFEVV